MLSSTKKRNTQGFTIIEVLIVLAIAGLILLIVFLAVPALQRNARNTQRKNDISGLLSGVTEFTNDNNGTAPNGAAFTAPGSGIIQFSGPAGTSTVNTTKLGYYKNAPAVFTTVLAGGSTSAVPSAPTVDDVDLIVGATCNGNTPAITSATGATSRGVVAYYSVEQSGGTVQQCQGS